MKVQMKVQWRCKQHSKQSLDLTRCLFPPLFPPGPCSPAIGPWPRHFFWVACPSARYQILQLLIALQAGDSQSAVTPTQIRYTYLSLRVLCRLFFHSAFQGGVETNPLKCAC